MWQFYKYSYALKKSFKKNLCLKMYDERSLSCKYVYKVELTFLALLFMMAWSTLGNHHF